MTLVCKSWESVMTSLWPTCLHQPTVLSNILTTKYFHDKNNFAWCNGIVYTSPAGQHQLFCMKLKPIFTKRGWGKTIIRRIFGCDSPRSPNVCPYECMSHLLQLYWTSEWLSNDFWRTSKGLWTLWSTKFTSLQVAAPRSSRLVMFLNCIMSNT